MVERALQLLALGIDIAKLLNESFYFRTAARSFVQSSYVKHAAILAGRYATRKSKSCATKGAQDPCRAIPKVSGCGSFIKR
jgi:hypothetical protein